MDRILTKPKNTHHKAVLTTLPKPRTILARHLDVLAGIELQHGHHGAAEFLARRAVEIREARQ